MTKKELITILKDVPDNAKIFITENSTSLLGNSCSKIEVQGFYRHYNTYVLCGLDVRPSVILEHD